MGRAGGWIVGLAIVLSMAGGSWLALRRIFTRETVTVVYLHADDGRGPTNNALWRGAQFALREAGASAGKFRIRLQELAPGIDQIPPVAAWIGTSEGRLLQGDVHPAPFFVSALDTHPLEPAGCFRILPGCDRQGCAAASWANSSKYAKVFVLCDKASLASEAISRAFLSKGRELGLAIEGPADPLEGRLALVDRIVAARVDLVFYSGEEAPYVTATEVFSALRERGFKGALLTAEADPEVSCLAVRTRLVDGSFLVSPFAPPPKPFAAEYAAQRGSAPGPHVTAGYFAMKAAIEAIGLAQSIEPDELRRAAGKLPYFDKEGKAAYRPCALYGARKGMFEFIEILN